MPTLQSLSLNSKPEPCGLGASQKPLDSSHINETVWKVYTIYTLAFNTFYV